MTERSLLLRSMVVASLCGATSLAHGQTADSVTLYGIVDTYLAYLHSSSGASLKGPEEGGILRSRLGFRGNEDLGSGYSARFQLEMGLTSTTGAMAGNGFDRQSWVGLASNDLGEVRLGRQNTAVFYRGDYLDFTARTLGSIINAFGVTVRYNNDVSYLSPRWGGAMVEFHYAPSESAYGRQQGIYQAAIDYVNGPYRAGYAGLRARAPSTARYSDTVKYDEAYLNYNYGPGRVYLAFVRANNSTVASGLNNAGAILASTGGLVDGTNPDVQRFYNVTQVSVDYNVTALFKVGAIYGRIKDTSGSARDARGGSLGGFYQLSKRTSIYGMLDRINNNTNAGFRIAGSAGLPYNFTSPGDVNGKRIEGVQLGILHRF